MKKNAHKWNFIRAGGSNQADIRSGKDIENIGSLDAKLWSALSCPTSGLTLDNKTLSLIDTDGDGRIRRNEIVAACQWACARLKNADSLLAASESLPLAEIDDSDDEGKILIASAKEVLQNLGKSGATSISVADFADESAIFANSPFNADGIITELSCPDAETKAAFAEILACSTPKKDRSGLDGIDAADIAAFFDNAQAFIAWSDVPATNSSVKPFGEATAAAAATVAAVAEQIDEWFARARIMAYDTSVEATLQTQNVEKLAKASDPLDFDSLKKLPIVKLNTTATIDFSASVNPAYAAECAAFCNFLQDNYKTSVLTESVWGEIKARLSAFDEWIAAKPACANADVEHLRQIATADMRAKLSALIDADNARAKSVENIAAVERLVRYHRDLFVLLKNFVCFADFYAKDSSAIFQYGKLFIDRRVCELCVKVENPAAHAKMASLGYGYLAYLHCRRKGEADIDIVALVSAGDSDNLIVGRNGIFYDYLGRDWDATITNIVSNPIGISQAFFSPYKRLIAWASDFVSKQASQADKAVVADLTAPKADAKDKKIDIGTVAALGVAVGGITTAFGMVLDALFGLGYWLPLGLVGIVLAISLPSMFIAWFKLGMRNLAPILDGNGWAVNGKSVINISFGSHLTKVARLPRGSRVRADIFRERHTFRNALLCVVAAACVAAGALYYFGYFDSEKTECSAEAKPAEQSATAALAQSKPASAAQSAPAAK